MNQLLQLARDGMAMLFISAEIDELLRVSTRIVVMRDRRQVGELPGGSTRRRGVRADRRARRRGATAGRERMQRLLAALPLFWPCATLALLLALNAALNPGFLAHRAGATATCTATSSTS